MIQKRFLTIAAAAFLLRAAFILAVGAEARMFVTPDSPIYLRLAENIREFHSFSSSETPPLEADTVRTPGYPLFLLPFGGHVLAIAWAQALLGALTAGLLFLTANALWKRPNAALATGVAIAIDYVIILYCSFVMTEPLFLFFFTLSLYFFARFLGDPSRAAAPLALSALAYGASALVRPVSLYYFLVPSIVLLSMKAGKHLLLFLAFAMILPAQWFIRNKMVSGTWTFTTIQGLTRAAILEERLSHGSFEESYAKLQLRFDEENPQNFPSPAAKASAESVWAGKYVMAHPKDYAIVLMKEAVRLIAGNGMKASAWLLFKDPEYDPLTVVVHPKEGNSEQARTLWSRHPSLGVSLALYLTFLALIYSLAAAGLATAWRTMRPAAIWLGLTTVYFFLVSIGFGTGARYRITLMPGLFLLAGLGFDRMRATFSGKPAPGNSRS